MSNLKVPVKPRRVPSNRYINGETLTDEGKRILREVLLEAASIQNEIDYDDETDEDRVNRVELVDWAVDAVDRWWED